MYIDGMGQRQSMAVEILDTVRFGGLDKIKGATGYAKRKLDNGDAYVIPFGLSKRLFGIVVISTPKKLYITYRLNNKDKTVRMTNAWEVKRFLVNRFIQNM
jgi:hypothetical protein